MTCPQNLGVFISEQFIAPPKSIRPQSHTVDDVTVITKKLIFYVPTDEDIEYVTTEYDYEPMGFEHVIIDKQSVYESETDEYYNQITDATIVYWNPLLPVRQFGVGTTYVFTMLLTDALYQCPSVNVVVNLEYCPVFIDYTMYPEKDFIPLNGNAPYADLPKMYVTTTNNFIICFDRETTEDVKILNTKRIMILLSSRQNGTAKFGIKLPSYEINQIIKALEHEKRRRILKGYYKQENCSLQLIDLHSVRYLTNAQKLLGITYDEYNVVNLIDKFKPLIKRYLIIPEVLSKLNNVDGCIKQMRLYCRGNSISFTNLGLVPANKEIVCSQFTKEPPCQKLINAFGTSHIVAYTAKHSYYN